MLSVCYGSCLSQVSFPYRRFEEIVLEEIVLDEEIDQDFKSENRSLVRSPTSEQVSILYAPDSSGAGYDDLVSVERQDKIMYKLVEVMFRARRGHSASGCSTELGIPDSSSDSSSFAGDDDVGSVELGDEVIKEIGRAHV